MIYVFKTSVKNEDQVKELKPHLDRLFPTSKWSFDLEDCDKVFRIESPKDICDPIQSLFGNFNFDCAELK